MPLGVCEMARVLVVEDDPDIRMLVVARVKSAGHAVLAAGDAEEALTLVADKGLPDLAVLDVSLPGMDGLELCTKLREQGNSPDLPVIFLTARVNQEDVDAGTALGGTYLTKPVVTTALLNAIRHGIAENPNDPTKPIHPVY